MGDGRIDGNCVFMTEDGEIIGFQNGIVDAPNMTLSNIDIPNVYIPEKWDLSATISGSINWTAFGKFVLPRISEKRKRCKAQINKCIHRWEFGKTWKVRKKNMKRCLRLTEKYSRRWGEKQWR